MKAVLLRILLIKIILLIKLLEILSWNKFKFDPE